MSDFEEIETEFVDAIQNFFRQDRINSIAPGHGGRNGAVTHVSAVVNVKGDNIGLYDGPNLLKTIKGTIVANDETMVVIEGQFLGRDCRVTITCSAAASFRTS